MTALKELLRVVALRRVPFWQRSRPRRLARFAVFVLYVYVGVILVLLWLENRFLFHPTTFAQGWADPPAGVGVRDVELQGPGGVALHAWWSAPPGWEPGHGAVLYCHGNAGNLSHRGADLRDWHAATGLGVLLFDYPGYGKSAGRPTEAGCYAAADAAYAWLTKEAGVPGDAVVLFGESLGAAVAVDLAARHPCRAVVLLAPFSSFADMAQKTFPFLPARWLVRNDLNSARKIAGYRGPVLIAHGTADTLVPYSQGQRLYAAVPGPKVFLPLEGAGHNTPPGPAFYAAVGAFLREHAPRPAADN